MSARKFLSVLALAGLMACEQTPDPTGLDVEPAFEIGSTLPAGSRGGFFFLPPIAPGPGARPAASFDASLEPDVLVCAWDGAACSATVAEMSFGSGSGSVRLDEVAEQYVANWHTSRTLDPDASYRILVRVAGAILGVADVDLVVSAKELKGVDDGAVGLVRGRTLPIKFRIEKGAVTVVGPSGGKVEVPGATLVVRDGGVKEPTGITVTSVDDYPPHPDGVVLPGTVFDFGPDGLDFDRPSELTIAYDPGDLGPGIEETSLRLYQLIRGRWVMHPQSHVDVDAKTVTGQIPHFSTWAVGGMVLPLLSGEGAATIDGVVDGEWANADSHVFDVETAEGIVSGALYVMNDGAELYLGLVYPESTLQPFTEVYYSFHDAEGGLFQAGDDALKLSWDGDAWFEDQVCIDAGGFGYCGEADVWLGGTSEGEGAIAHAGGVTTFELRHPLDSDDDAHDFSLVPGDRKVVTVSVNIPGAGGELLGAFLLVGVEIPGGGTWTTTGPMSRPRVNHRQTTLGDGRVLVVGGPVYPGEPELYDPATGAFSDVGPSAYTHGNFPAATLMADGRVLVTGGDATATSAEIFDPVTGTFSATGDMTEERFNHSATLLADGRVLIAGGAYSIPGVGVTSRGDAEIFDPLSGIFTPVGPLVDHRSGHDAVLLPDGKVLIYGGTQNSMPGFGICLNRAELFDPVTNSFSPTGSALDARCGMHWTRMALLPSGQVFVAGDDRTAAELYDPVAGTFSPAGVMASSHAAGSVTRLGDGRVLVAGGVGPTPSGNETHALAEIYDPATGLFVPTRSLNDARQQGTASLLLDGRVLVTGGATLALPAPLASAEIHPGN